MGILARPNKYESWGRYPQAVPQHVTSIHWRDEARAILQGPGPFLAYGQGRSYGDSCLNEGGHLLHTTGMDRISGFDQETGSVECEAGVTLAELLELFVPKGWFLPVTPGTKFVTVGGAIANDVHGKNHHAAGTFGCHIEYLELLRSDGNVHLCSRQQNPELFSATIGGLGLTGLILKARLQLKRITSAQVMVEALPYRGLDEFYSLTEKSEAAGYEYTVAWLDCLARTPRGVFLRGRHADGNSHLLAAPSKMGISVPIQFPRFTINRYSIQLFNTLYWWKNTRHAEPRLSGFEEFFYPLDSIGHWNLIYGERGPLQYQCVVPESGTEAFAEILQEIAKAGEGSFLGVIKKFGSRQSPGMMSFPRPGLTLALDFAPGARTFRLFERLDAIVLACKGALNPSKDARMPSALFRCSFPRHPEFESFIDPKFSSSFWRRVHA